MLVLKSQSEISIPMRRASQNMEPEKSALYTKWQRGTSWTNAFSVASNQSSGLVAMMSLIALSRMGSKDIGLEIGASRSRSSDW